MFGLIARFLPGLMPAASALLNPWVLLAIAAASGWLWFQGYKVGASKLEAYRAEQLQAATKLYLARERVTERVVNHYIKVQGETRTITEYVDREVTRYAEGNPGFSLDAAWRVLHDDAARNVIPPPGLIPDGAGGAPPRAAEALTTVTQNYAACHRTADRLDALQLWVREQEKVKP